MPRTAEGSVDTTLPSGTLVSWDTGTPGPRAICADWVSTCEAMEAGPDVARASRGRFMGGGRETGVSVISTLLRCWDLCFSSLARRRCSSHCCSRAVGDTQCHHGGAGQAASPQGWGRSRHAPSPTSPRASHAQTTCKAEVSRVAPQLALDDTRLLLH